jgi:hypothetical protein
MLHNFFGGMKSGWLQFIRLQLYSGGLTDKIEPEQHRGHPITLFHPSFHATQWTRFDFDSRTRTNFWRQMDLEVRFQRLENLIKLSNKLQLIMNYQQISHMIGLNNRLPLRRQQLKENVPGKQRLIENNLLSSIFSDAPIAGQGDWNASTFTELLKFFFPSRSRVGYEPCQITHH